MKHVLVFILLSVLTCHAQYSTVTGTFVDSSGTNLVSGQIIFAPNDGYGNPITYTLSTGQITKKPTTCNISAGLILSGCKVANTLMTTPVGVCFQTTVKNPSNQVVWGPYMCVKPVGSTYDLNTFHPATAPIPRR